MFTNLLIHYNCIFKNLWTNESEKINQKNFYKTYPILKNYPQTSQIIIKYCQQFKINLKFIFFSPDELDAIEYLMNQLNLPSQLFFEKSDYHNDNLRLCLEDFLNDGLIIEETFSHYFFKELNKNKNKNDYDDEKIHKNLQKIENLKKWINDLNISPQNKEKLQDPYKNDNQEILNTILNEQQIKDFKSMKEDAIKDLYELSDKIQVSSTEINDFANAIEQLLKIKLSKDFYNNDLVKIFIINEKRWFLWEPYYGFLIREGTRAVMADSDMIEKRYRAFFFLILDEILIYKNKNTYGLINFIIFILLFDHNNLTEIVNIIDKNYYMKQLNKHNITYLLLVKILADWTYDMPRNIDLNESPCPFDKIINTIIKDGKLFQ